MTFWALCPKDLSKSNLQQINALREAVEVPVCLNQDAGIKGDRHSQLRATPRPWLSSVLLFLLS
jgi:hypothetical protein